MLLLLFRVSSGVALTKNASSIKKSDLQAADFVLVPFDGKTLGFDVAGGVEQVCVSVCVCMRVSACLSVCLCAYVCVVYVCVYIDRIGSNSGSFA